MKLPDLRSPESANHAIHNAVLSFKLKHLAALNAIKFYNLFKIANKNLMICLACIVLFHGNNMRR